MKVGEVLDVKDDIKLQLVVHGENISLLMNREMVHIEPDPAITDLLSQVLKEHDEGLVVDGPLLEVEVLDLVVRGDGSDD